MIVVNKNRVISIARGICIILMVIGHSGCPGLLYKFIYLFHMPFFFFASGYFCRPEQTLRPTDEGIGLYRRILRRFKRLYLPFILYGIVFLLLHDFFLNIGIYNPVNDGAAYDLNAFLGIALKMFLKMEFPSRLLGAFWFLRSLLIAAVAVDIALYFLRNKPKAQLFLAPLAALVVLVLRLAPDGTPVIRQLIPAAMGGFFFLLGMNYRKVEEKFKPGILVQLIILALLVVLAWLKPMSMDTPGVLDSALYMVVAPMGILLVMKVSEYLDRTPVCKAVEFIGDNSLTILGLHYLCFKPVSLLAIKALGLPSESLSAFPVIPDLGGAWWVLYSVAGLLIPLVVSLAVPRKF